MLVSVAATGSCCHHFFKEQGMLLLTRKVDEEIRCTTADGSVIVVKLCGIRKDNRAIIGIHADDSVNIVRTEVLRRDDKGHN